MAHVRKQIRRVLNDMGFDNCFHISDYSLDHYYRGGALVVTIRDWEPHRDSLLLKKRLQRCTEGEVEVCFQLCGQPRRVEAF